MVTNAQQHQLRSLSFIFSWRRYLNLERQELYMW